jgi:hypothetical protein
MCQGGAWHLQTVLSPSALHRRQGGQLWGWPALHADWDQPG